jgi:hypothetical protein
MVTNTAVKLAGFGAIYFVHGCIKLYISRKFTAHFYYAAHIPKMCSTVQTGTYDTRYCLYIEYSMDSASLQKGVLHTLSKRFSHRGTAAEGNAIDERLSQLLLSTHIRRSKNRLDKLVCVTLNSIVAKIAVQYKLTLCTQRSLFT